MENPNPLNPPYQGGFPLNSPLIRGARGVKNDERWVSCTVSKVGLQRLCKKPSIGRVTCGKPNPKSPFIRGIFYSIPDKGARGLGTTNVRFLHSLEACPCAGGRNPVKCPYQNQSPDIPVPSTTGADKASLSVSACKTYPSFSIFNFPLSIYTVHYQSLKPYATFQQNAVLDSATIAFLASSRQAHVISWTFPVCA